MRGWWVMMVVLLGLGAGALAEDRTWPGDLLAVRQSEPPDAADGLWLIPQDGPATVVVPADGGRIADLAVDPTGDRVAFAWSRQAQNPFRLAILNLTTRQVTAVTPVDGRPGEDRYPAWLADGSLVFRSTRMGQRAPDGEAAGALFLVQADGRFLRRITWDQDILGPPQVLADGRIRYLRRDGLSRPSRPVAMTMHADGSHQKAWYAWTEGGDQPGRLVAGGGDLETAWVGRGSDPVLDYLWRVQRVAGITAPDGLTAVPPPPVEALTELPQGGWMAVQGSDVRWGPEPGRWTGRRALPAGRWIAVAARQPRTWYGVFPSVVDQRQPTGFLYVQDIRLGTGMTAAQGARATQVRVVSLRWPGLGSGQEAPTATILGTVPLEADGSLFVQVPARQPVTLQVLDAGGAVVGTMRSWVALQPGERLSCVGCHTDERQAPPRGRPVLAFLREPRVLPAQAQMPVEVSRRVLPTLATRCGDCHAEARVGSSDARATWKRLRAKGWWTPDPQGRFAIEAVMAGRHPKHPTITWSAPERDQVAAWAALGGSPPEPEATVESRARAATWAQEEARHLRDMNLHLYGGIEQ